MNDKLIAIGAVVGVVILAGIIRGLFRKKPADIAVQSVSCSYCSWRGRVSRYAGRCPQCNEPLGDRAAKRRT